MTFDIDISLKILSFLLSLGAIFYAFFANRRKDVDHRFGEGTRRMDRHEKRLQAMEQTVSSMPGKDDMHNLQLEAVKQTGALAEMRAVMEGNQKIMIRLEAIVSRHEEHLLDGARK